MKYLDEPQIFRIDHYLGKETVQNLLALRFSNEIFERLWGARNVDHVQITVAEAEGVGTRAMYYDHSGALRDMVQNHILQVLSLLTMEAPVSLDSSAIRDAKLNVLRTLRPIRREDARSNTVRARYAAGVDADGKPVPSYMDEQGIADNSRTETFVALKTYLDNWRWSGVPFFIRTGKRMKARASSIYVQFKDVPQILFNRESKVSAQRADNSDSARRGLFLRRDDQAAGAGPGAAAGADESQLQRCLRRRRRRPRATNGCCST